MDVLQSARLKLGVEPLGGAGVHYWGLMSDRYHLPLTIVNEGIDPTFRFMTLDWDGEIRMDCTPAMRSTV
jgi:phosphoglucomutase